MRDMRYRNSLRTHQKTTQDTAPTRREVEYTQPPAHKTSSPLHTVIDKRIQSSFVNLKKPHSSYPTWNINQNRSSTRIIWSGVKDTAVQDRRSRETPCLQRIWSGPDIRVTSYFFSRPYRISKHLDTSNHIFWSTLNTAIFSLFFSHII